MPTRWNERPRCQSEVWRIRTAPTLGRFQGHPCAPRQDCGRRDERLAGGRPAPRATSGTPGSAAGGTLGAMTQQGARRDLVLLLGGALVSTAGSSLTVVAVLIHLRPLGS